MEARKHSVTGHAFSEEILFYVFLLTSSIITIFGVPGLVVESFTLSFPPSSSGILPTFVCDPVFFSHMMINQILFKKFSILVFSR